MKSGMLVGHSLAGRTTNLTGRLPVSAPVDSGQAGRAVQRLVRRGTYQPPHKLSFLCCKRSNLTVETIAESVLLQFQIKARLQVEPEPLGCLKKACQSKGSVR
jgi:hypothetical protein